MGASDRSLRKLFDVADAARRVNAEIQRLFEEEFKENELQFYKELVQRNMTKTQIEALQATYRSSHDLQPQGAWALSEKPYMSHQPPTATPPHPPPPVTVEPPMAPVRPPLAIAQNPNRSNGAGSSYPPPREPYKKKDAPTHPLALYLTERHRKTRS
ncbi:hypothetical protein N7G274_010808 [Stereocaulon virgatum]|uniref:Uncharacterized protein n=1 Tax=Stereocaulon virgatum TaxID=373712 RepID=A0ABR3ZZI0_9LECA